MHQKVMRYVTLLLLFLGASALLIGQTCPANKAHSVVLIDTDYFGDERVGIVPYVLALRDASSDTFGEPQKELRLEIAAIDRDIQNINDHAAEGSAETKQRELEVKLKKKQDLLKELVEAENKSKQVYERRRAIVLGPIEAEIRNAMPIFAKERCYDVILDLSKIPDAVLYLDNDSFVTKEFITWFNARRKSTIEK